MRPLGTGISRSAGVGGGFAVAPGQRDDLAFRLGFGLRPGLGRRPIGAEPLVARRLIAGPPSKHAAQLQEHQDCCNQEDQHQQIVLTAFHGVQLSWRWRDRHCNWTADMASAAQIQIGSMAGRTNIGLSPWIIARPWLASSDMGCRPRHDNTPGTK